MPLADLLSAIEADATEELGRLDRESRDEASAILEQARAEASALEAGLVADVEAVAYAEAERIRAAARIEAAASLRAAREEAFAATLDAVRARLANTRETSRYPELFASLLEESRSALPGAPVLWVDPRDQRLARQLAVAEQIEASLDTWGGVELEADRRVVRNTLEHRMESAVPILRRRFASSLLVPVETAVRT